jgi:cellulose synthase/poly-beta-1,6-N-acetylglucosamine synthase-like glycosyltransferase
MHIILILSGMVSFIYILLIVSFYLGWQKLQNVTVTEKESSKYTKGINECFISVIVAARNETSTIKKLIDSLHQQELPENFYEVIIINDHSEDSTCQLVETCIQNYKNFRLISLPDKKYGKKQAILLGIQVSRGKLIVTTDADCWMSSRWLSTILAFYRQYPSKMIIGPVFMPANSFFDSLQSLEFLSLIASTAGAAGLGRPIMCNGANLIYEKDIFQALQNPLNEKINSGDDVFLMLQIKKHFPESIRFLKSMDAVVYTKPQTSLKGFIHQRVRWASKSKYYRDFDVILVSLVVFFTNLLLFSFLVLSFFQLKFFYYFLIFFMLKALPDFLFLRKTTHFYKKNNWIKSFIFLEIIYSFYILFVSLISLTCKYQWKDRAAK